MPTVNGMTSTAIDNALAGVATALDAKADLSGGVLTSGQIPSNVMLRGDMYIDVKDPAYGAKGDGTTDDTAAIQAAITAAGTTGTIYFPNGTYLISQTLTVKTNWKGDGWSSVIKQANGANLSVMLTTSTSSTTSYLTIMDLLIDGNRANNSTVTCYGFYAWALQYSHIRNVRIQNVNGDGWRFDGGSVGGFGSTTSTVHLTDCWAYSCANNGLVLTSYAADVHILGGDYGFCGASAIDMQGGSSSIRGATLWGVSAGPGLIIGAPAVQVTDCNIEGNNQQGILVNQYGSYALITGCKIYDNSTAGNGSYDAVYINGVSGTLVTGVSVIGNQIFADMISGGTTQKSAVTLGTYHQDCQVHGNSVGFAGAQAAWAPSVNLIKGTASGDVVTSNAGYITSNSLGWFNVMDYLAKGDGVTDDTAAIQAAINAVPSTGGVVYLPPGNYFLNGSTGLKMTVAGTVLKGAGAETTKITIGSSFSDTTVVSITAYACQVMDLAIFGANTTTTSNPVARGIQISGVRKAKVTSCIFYYINSWAIEVAATSAGSNSNPLGTQLNRIYANACAGGVHFIGNSTQGYAMNSSITDIQCYQGGYSTGGSSNLDAILIEDAWDVLVENAIVWQNAGTGSSLHIKGNSAASFINNLDALGPLTGVCVKVEDGTNGSPQNTQITGGVIQQGNIGMQVSGGAKQLHLISSRLINNVTHGLQVDGSATTIYIDSVFFSQSGNGAAGTNYDINWSGTAVGFVTNCRFASPVVSVGTAGVQNTVNVATAGQNVRFINASFQGTNSTSANWFNTTSPAGLPSAVLEVSSGKINFATQTYFTAAPSLRPSSSTNFALAVNVNGADANDRFRILGSGDLQCGPGSAARDSTWGRQGVAQYGTPDSDIVINLAGKGLKIKEGTNARMGTATLVAGSVSISNTSITANTRIFVTTQLPGGTVGHVYVNARSTGISFGIASTSSTDTSVVAWLLVEPA